MESTSLLLAALALQSYASAQCNLANETFSGGQVGQQVTVLNGWSSSGPGALIGVSPVTGSQALVFPSNATTNATYAIAGNTFGNLFDVTFQFQAQVDSTFSIGCPAIGAFRASVGLQVASLGPGGGFFAQAISLDTPGSVVPISATAWNTAQIQIDLAGNYSVLINGTQIHTGPWNPPGVPACPAPDSIFFGTIGTGIFSSFGMYVDNICINPPIIPTIGTPYCTANVNASGTVGSLVLTGSDVATANNVTMLMQGLNPNLFGIALVSASQGSTPLQNGILCLSGPIGRFGRPGEIFQANSQGDASQALDIASLPLPAGTVTAMAGETWNFQAWYRDFDSNGVPAANLTNGVSITFN